jgi:predicted RNA-binding Zn-ribbon protein involved in translation (DUF1610 family)
MDMSTIAAALTSIKAAKELLQAATGLKIDNDTRVQINKALNEVSEIQEKLFDAREQLYNLQQENDTLRQQLKASDDWHSRLEKYELIQTSGGAVIYKSRNNTPMHFVCPNCIEKKAMQILQDVQDGEYRCPGCQNSYWTAR